MKTTRETRATRTARKEEEEDSKRTEAGTAVAAAVAGATKVTTRRTASLTGTVEAFAFKVLCAGLVACRGRPWRNCWAQKKRTICYYRV